MNLFVTSTDPMQAALELDDNRVNKIALEATQILSTVLAADGITGFYRPTHIMNPITIWALADRAHAAWTLRYGLALCDVYSSHRYRVHGCRPVLQAMRKHIRCTREPEWYQNSARHKRLGLDFTDRLVTEAYRLYLCARWPNDKRQPTWTGRARPVWAVF